MQFRTNLVPGWLYPIMLVLAFLAATLSGPHMSRAQQTPRAKPQRITVIDADTVEINGESAQLFGIDAPELGQLCMNGDKTWHCGRDAAFMLKKVIALDDVTCTPFGNGKSKDQHDGLATVVCKGNRQDVSEVLLRNGYAVVLEKTLPVYTAAEGEARRTGVGLWRGRFVSPADWRKGERLEEETARTQSPCNVKGVIDNGRRIYYVPTDRKHDSVKVDQTRGDRVFCSDEEARAAQWRRPSARRS